MKCIVIAVAQNGMLWLWTKSGMKRMDAVSGPVAEIMDEDQAEYARKRLIQVQEDGMVATKNHQPPFKYHVIAVE